MARVLVIDGDGARRVSLASSLGDGHDIEMAASAMTGLELARASRPDLVLVEAALPDGRAESLCTSLRADPALASILLVVIGAGASEAERVGAFEAGADDVVVRPFSTRELSLRVRAVLRRQSRRRAPAETVSIGPLAVDRHARRVTVDGVRVALTRREFDLLLRLLDSRGRVLTRTLLVSELWPDDAASMRVVDTTLKRIRRKLPWLATRIRTVRGVGYELHGEER